MSATPISCVTIQSSQIFIKDNTLFVVLYHSWDYFCIGTFAQPDTASVNSRQEKI